MSDPNRNECSYSEKPNNSDTISRQAAIDVANKLIDRFEQILRDIRETNEDESVCGMCEYDGAFIGQSGDWCNECPGFDRADCFKLSEERRKKWLKELDLPAAQPEQTKMIKEIRKWINSGNRGSADYFIVDKIEEIINRYE